MPWKSMSARISVAKHGVDAAEGLQSPDLLRVLLDSELTALGRRLAHVLDCIRSETDRRGLA
jgi:hypothetical protein